MTTLRLYNTLTKAKEDFAPIDPANVRMYVCGPTVYDFAHIGNARPVIVFDVLFRLLRHLYGAEHVTYVRNITDIDDKINARAAERAAKDLGGRNVPILDVVREITNETTRIYDEDVAALGCLPPSVTPRATEHVGQMIAMIAELIDAGHAYPAEGHVLFDVSSKPDYGKLSRRPLDEMISGARVEIAPYKKNPMDFVLWKPSDAATPGWDSPWGRGRPGWHIECSAMAGQYLGETFDIHGGGIDLLFPHHENEIAQSEAAHHNHPLANVWMHNGFLQVEGEKMSKSLGNFVTIHELLTGWNGYRWPGSVLRFAMLTAHYRQPIDWTQNRLEASAITVEELGRFSVENNYARPSPEIVAALEDDLNTPKVITELHRLLGEAKRFALADPVDEFGAPAVLYASCEFLGLKCKGFRLQDTVLRSFDKAEIVRAIDARNAARKAKNFKESDRIRDELLAQGIALKDNPDGTTSWEVKR
jgi:cysteinyl-tRNA synthetase